jgi:hypothetical protein
MPNSKVRPLSDLRPDARLYILLKFAKTASPRLRGRASASRKKETA